MRTARCGRVWVLYHAKMGIVTDANGDRLVFKGSINETPAGWKSNCESFDVNCSWRGDRDAQRVQKSLTEFSTLWTGQAKSARVLDFPDALKEKLLEFLPTDDTFVRPPRKKGEDSEPEPEEETPEVEEEQPVAKLTEDERMRQVWSFIKNAPKRSDGAMVAVETSAVEPWPHQLRAYKRMLDSWPFRLLIADEVGLGKTIEAGLIIRHVWISELAKRILIMVPAGILQQWQSELYEKFNLLVPIYTGQALVWPNHHGAVGPLQQKIKPSDWTKQPIVLVSSHLMRRRDRQQELEEAADWDLLVLDEAHHARRKAPGSPQEGGPNRLLRLMHKIKGKASSLLLMTATPMQIHPVELWDLLSVLGLPSNWSSETFVEYFDVLGRNPSEKELQEAAKLFQITEEEFGETLESELERVADTFGLGKIARKKVIAALREPDATIPLKRLNTKQRQAALMLLKLVTPIRHRMSRHTRNLLREYFKKGLLDSPIADRQVTDVPVELTTAEREVYDAIEDYIRNTYEAASPDTKTAVGFVMTIYRRRLASCFYALRQTLTGRLARLTGASVATVAAQRCEEDISQDEDVEEVLGADEAEELETQALHAEEQDAIQGLLKSIAKLGTDTKALCLVDHLNQAFADGYDSALVFTQYTDTADFLREFLAERLDVPIGCFTGRGGELQDHSGRWERCSKEEIKRKLREGKIRLLVCNEAAGEGLNLQTCGVLVNYDLPWNPRKVEQRIGRIDRIGQKYPKIRIINFAYADTVEADVYFALSQRIGLFHGIVGKLQPILSKLPKVFETATLRRREEAERSRHDAVHNVEGMVGEAEEAGFDIDEVSEAELMPPDLPPSPLLPSQVEEVLRREELLPSGVECHELEPSTFKMRLPGQAEWSRVTASPEMFDEHFESHQMALHDSPVFRCLIECAGIEADDQAADEGTTLANLLAGESARRVTINKDAVD